MNLQHNSKEMKTVVETFVIEETAELIYDNEKLDKWNGLVEELGLTGQTKIVTKDKSPIPFMHMKKSLQSVFETLCPCKINVSDYSTTPIPVEILDLVALSKREGYFTAIQIWYDDKSPDPVCVGIKSEYYVHSYQGVPEAATGMYPTKEAGLAKIKELSPSFNELNGFGWHTDGEKYLLGKWADVKHSFSELKKMAVERFVSEKGNEYRKEIRDTQRKLDDLETEAFDRFNKNK